MLGCIEIGGTGLNQRDAARERLGWLMGLEPKRPGNLGTVVGQLS